MKIIKKVSDFIKLFCQKCKQFWHWYKSLYIGTPWWKKTIAVICSLIVGFFLYLGAVDVNLFWLFGKSPGWLDISEHKTSEASVLYSADGVELCKYFNENRTPVEYSDVNPTFWRALIDTEDERYYNHWGVDPIGLVGAVKDAATGRGGRGASTITQQLAKNMFRTRSRYSTGLMGYIPGVKMLIMKTKEWITAIKLELYFSCTKGRTGGKNEILVEYANTVDFGNNAFGIKTAAKTYFNATPKELTTDQCAILVGMLKATTFYNPISHPDNCIKRRNQVLENMKAHGDLTADELKKYSDKQIDVSEFKVEENYDGQAMYFREAVQDELKQWCEDNDMDLYTSGLKIYTTLDSRMQKYAEEAAAKQMKQVQRNFNNHWGNKDPWVDEHGNPIPDFINDLVKKQPVYIYLTNKYPNNPDSVLYYLNQKHPVNVFTWDDDTHQKTMDLSVVDSIKYMVKFMHCSFIAMEPNTGYVKAYVGDIDFKSWKYDKAQAMRQPGSTFKLFVYTEAMNQGLTPCDKRRDEYFSMRVWDKASKSEVTWAPTNANGYFSGDSLPLKSAFAQSINSVAVRLGQEMGIKRIAETANKMGIKSPLDETPSLALGSSDVNLLELINAYCTVADNGKHHDPILVTRIVDNKGKEVYVAPSTEEQVIPYKSAFLMQQMLEGGLVEAGGTSQSLRGYLDSAKDTDFGGKTGTSNNHSDAWFMGVSPKIVVGAWVGGEYRCIHFRTGALGQGSRTALPICGYFLQSLMSDPAFKEYHGKFADSKDSDITSSMYKCNGYYSHKNDSVQSDSLGISSEVEELGDDNFDDDMLPEDEPKQHKQKQPTEQEINLDDL